MAVAPDEETSVTITFKASRDYGAPWIVFKAPSVLDALKMFEEDGEAVSKLMRETAGASVHFMNTYDKRNSPEPEKGSQGKPKDAGNGSANTGKDPCQEVTRDTGNACEHGDRMFIEHGGKKGWVCPLPKGMSNRCETLFV